MERGPGNVGGTGSTKGERNTRVSGGGPGSCDSKSSSLDLEKWESNLEARIGDGAESRWETLNTPLSGKRLGGT